MFRKLISHGSWKPSKTEFLTVLSCLSHEERVSVMRYAFQRDVLSSICGKILARQLASSLLSIQSNKILIERTDFGKPFVCGANQKLDFNISHGGNLTTLVAVQEGTCGVDVMRVELPPTQKSVTSFVHTLRKVFAPSEFDSIIYSPNEGMKMYRFYRHWCLKEAYLKALGCGIRQPLSSIVFELPASDGEPPCCLSLSSDSQHWHFEEHVLSDSHVAAVAWNSEVAVPHYQKQTFEELNITSLIIDLVPFDFPSDELWHTFTEKPHAPPLQRQAVIFSVLD